MTIDPAFHGLASDRMATARRPPPHVPIEAVRTAANRWMIGAAGDPAPMTVEALEAPSPAGSIALRLYRPSPAPELRWCLFVHGGGFVWGNLDTHDRLVRQLAAESGMAMVAVDYRLAPEAPFPAAQDDLWSALLWVRSHAPELGLSRRAFALCGDSAGGQLALATALTARDRGIDAAALGLFYPLLDPGCAIAAASPFADGPMLTLDAMRWFWESYRGERVPPNLLEADLRGLPPVSIVLGSADPLLGEGRRLADRLRAAAVPVELSLFEGMVHGFAGLPRVTQKADRAIAAVAADLRRRVD